jgi:hypothetical protein
MNNAFERLRKEDIVTHLKIYMTRETGEDHEKPEDRWCPSLGLNRVLLE